MEEEIIQPIDKALLKSELTPDKQLRMTNKSHNEIYIVTANDSPCVVGGFGRLGGGGVGGAGGGCGGGVGLGVGRFREIEISTAGGWSGKSMD